MPRLHALPAPALPLTYALLLTGTLLIATPPASAGEPETIYTVEGEVQPPRKIHAVAPAYPADAKAERATGVVIVRTVIDTSGAVREAKVVQTPREDLAAASLEAVRQWRFEPATLDGEPVTVYYQLTINFRLAEEEDDDGGEETTEGGPRATG